MRAKRPQAPTGQQAHTRSHMGDAERMDEQLAALAVVAAATGLQHSPSRAGPDL